MSKTAIKNPCKVITGPKTIFSYLNVNEPKVPLGGGTPKYSVSLIIPKSDTVTVGKIQAAIKKIAENGSYVYVVDSSMGAIAFINEAFSTDITAQLKAELGIK